MEGSSLCWICRCQDDSREGGTSFAAPPVQDVAGQRPQMSLYHDGSHAIARASSEQRKKLVTPSQPRARC